MPSSEIRSWRPSSLFQFEVALLLAGVTCSGCGSATPEQRLAGRWKGAPNVTEEVAQGIAKAAEGANLQPVVKSAAQFFGQLAADKVLSIDLILNPAGTVLIRGNTSALGLPPDTDGTWKVQPVEANIYQLELKTDQKLLTGKLILVDPNEFTLKVAIPVIAPNSGAEQQPAQENMSTQNSEVPEKTKQVSITFKREK